MTEYQIFIEVDEGVEQFNNCCGCIQLVLNHGVRPDQPTIIVRQIERIPADSQTHHTRVFKSE